MKKILSVILCLLMLGQIVAVSSFAVNTEDKFEIANPYEDVDWDTYKAYKTQLHCHTTASDGYLQIRDAVQKYYNLDYDIVAITDHGTINKGWNNAPDLIPLMRAVKKERTKNAPIDVMPKEEYESYINGTRQTTDSSVRTHKDGMLDVEKGIELNMATPFADCHLTGYWSDYGQGLAGVFGDYETPAAGVKKSDGISMLSHIGEYVYIEKDTVNHTGEKIDDYYVNKFARVFLDNAGSCVGMGINSATDEHTRCDRILYDQILAKTIPNGVVPWGFTFSDSHNEASMNDAYTYMMMNEKSQKSLRKCMEKGAFFSVSHYSNGYELNGMKELPDSEVDASVDAINMKETPMVTKITVDENTDTIFVECKNANQITWVSDGNVILRENVVDGKAEINLNDSNLLDRVNLFVRFYITGEEGICYSQPMVIKEHGSEFEAVYVPETNDISTKLRKLITVLDWGLFKWNPIIWLFKYFALGYSAFDNFFNAY